MAPAKAPEGIAPKDVLLTSMRNAWELAHQKAALVEEVEREIIILVKANAETLSSDSKNTTDEKIANLRAKIVALKIEIGLHLNAAQGLAKDVAPYEHPKVAQQDSKVIGNLTIVRRKF